MLAKLLSKVPDNVDRAALHSYIRFREATNRRIKLEKLSGICTDQESKITILIAGRSPASDYFARRFIGNNYLRESMGCLNRRAVATYIDEHSEMFDLVIVEGPRTWTDSEFDASCWRVPAAVRSQVDLEEAGDAPPWVNRGNRRNLRRIRQQGFASSVSRDESDFEFFYDKMYLPFVSNRFGELGQVRSKHRMRRRFRNGAIIWANLGSERLAATLVSSDGIQATNWIVATDPRYPDAVSLGSINATYLFSLEWAQQNSMKALSLGYSRACLADGVLVHKKYWGASLNEGREIRDDVLFLWRQMTPAISRFLKESPLVIRRGGKLAGLTAIDTDCEYQSKDRENQLRTLAHAGLSEIVVLTSANPVPDISQIRNIPILWQR